jgi:hypothetical protein
MNIVLVSELLCRSGLICLVGMEFHKNENIKEACQGGGMMVACNM